MLHWVWNFAELLQKDVNDSEGIKDVPLWLLNNPPPVESKCTVVRYILKYMLDKDTLSVFRDPVNLKKYYHLCTNEQCDSGKDFLRFFSSY